MGSVREAIQRAASVARQEPAKTQVFDNEYLYELKRAFEPLFKKDPEHIVTWIRKKYALDAVDDRYMGGGKREFVADWFEKHGFSDADAATMRRRIEQHSAAEAPTDD